MHARKTPNEHSGKTHELLYETLSTSNEQGAAFVEYALLLGLVGLTLVGALFGLADSADKLFRVAGKEVATSGGFE